MTRMQVLARATLAGLGLAGMGMILAGFKYMPMRSLLDMMPEERLYAVAGLVAAVVLAIGVLVLLWRLVGRDGPALRLAGEEGTAGVEAGRGQLAGALRFGCVAAGLGLLGLYSEVLWETLNPAVAFFASGREFFQSIIGGNYERAWELGFAGLRHLVYPIGFLAWTAYLLTGAEKLVRRLAGYPFNPSTEGSES